MIRVPKHFKGSVTRRDHPKDPADTFDEPNRYGWTPSELASKLYRKYGPTMRIEVDCDGQQLVFEGTALVAGVWPPPMDPAKGGAR